MKKILAFVLLFFAIFTISCNKEPYVENNLIVHYINVGQGDSTLIQFNGKNLLIDAGTRENVSNLIKYIDSYNIHSFDYVIATHPHDDHIGGMAQVINKYSIDNFYMPQVNYSGKIYEDMIDALKLKNIKIKTINPSTPSINLGKDISFSVFSPNNKIYENTNNYSPIIKIQYKKISFLFTGDAETEVEEEVLSRNYNLNSDVIKIGHHGSNTSTSVNFLQKVNPSIAIISVGKDNEYSHPNKEILDLLSKYKITYFRTDIDDTIILYSDGYKIYKRN
nr:ComEC/Rec2 family competence protein [Clostridium sp. MSJ-8]